MRVSLFSTAVLFLTLFAAGATALACDCLTPSVDEQYKRSDIVFEGEVVLVLQHKEHPQIPVAYVFHVSKMLKGKPVTEVSIAAGWTNCDADFTLNGVYRVFAYEYEGKLHSGICSGNKYLHFNPPQYLAAHTTSRSIWHSWYMKALIVLSFGTLLTSILYARAKAFPD